MVEQLLPQRAALHAMSYAPLPEWPKVARSAVVFVQVIRPARIVLTGRGSGMRCHMLCRYAVQDLPCLYGGHETEATGLLDGGGPSIALADADSVALAV